VPEPPRATTSGLGSDQPSLPEMSAMTSTDPAAGRLLVLEQLLDDTPR
jgi:hypothetical protein